MKKMKRILAMFLAVIMLSMTFTNTAYALTPSIDMVENCSGKKIAQGDKFSLEFEIFTDTTVLYHIELYKGTSTDSDSYIEKLDSDVLGGSLFPQHATVEIDTKKMGLEPGAYTLYYYIFYLKTNAKVSKKTATFYVTCNGNHKYNSGVVTKKPTCTQGGTMLYTCTGCGVTKTTSIPAAHAWNSGKVVLEPTVSKEGAKDCVCTVCGKSGRVATPAIFSDVQDDWYTSAVQYAYDNGLMTGIKGTTKFEPNSNITKAQVAQVLYNMENKPHVTANRVFDELQDVFEGEWYADAVSWAYNTGIVTGDTNARKFFPNANVTREQLALMLYRYAEYKGYDTSHWDDLSGLKNKENVSNWATTAVEWAVGAKLISGIDKNGVKDLAPGGNASRAQVATILMRFVEGIVSAP